MPPFCHLHCHTQYSLLDGAAGIETLIGRTGTMEMPAVAITDHGNLFGVPAFYHEARKKNVQPIIGCEFYLTPSGMEDRRDKTRFHQVLLAKNLDGYHNLMKLSSKSFTNGFYYKPRLDRDLLRRYSDGLVATTCCIQGEVPQTILKRGEEAGRAIFEAYLDIFGDDYYIEIQDHELDKQHRINEILLRWSKEYDVPLVATNDVHYVEQKDADAQDVLLCLQTGADYNDPNRMRFDNDQFFLKSADEMASALHRLTKQQRTEAMENTRVIADKCNLELPMGELLMPHFPIPDEFEGDAEAYLRHLVFEKAKERYGTVGPDLQERLNSELGIIQEMGYAGYFLIVQDFTNAARELDVRVGPGRGSAAGSAVAYCLGITNVDPLAYDLLFERFLNPERVSMPDIDIDFDDRGRSKVIDYVVEKYGRENVCQIITFGTMGAKTALRDVARVLNISLDEADRIAKMVPDGPGVSLDDAIDQNPDFARLKKQEETRELLRYAQVLEGSARHTGVHAAGVIIAPGEVSDYVPVATASSKDDRVMTTQYDGDWVEKFGLLKMDFLGLKTLTILNDALELIEENHGVEIDLDDIPLDDEETFALFQRGETKAIFQFESDGMTEYMRQLKPTSVDDLIAMNALYRPGPMELIPDYIRRKHGEEKIEYDHPLLEPVLERTYGIPVYQEQVMKMAQVMANFSLGQADILRRAMGKKKESVMKKQREVFLDGARENGIDEKTAQQIFEKIQRFAGYGFNKSHSAAYSIVAYQTAYLKAHYPAEFMAAAMTSEMSNTDRLAQMLEEARSLNLSILPPSINHSMAHFSVDADGIRFGLGAIKNVGLGAIEAIVSVREKEGAFERLFDLTEHVDLRAAGKKAFECLAAAGALDELEGHRAQLYEAAEAAVQYGQQAQADRAAGQNSLFGGTSESTALRPKLPETAEWSRARKLKEERELMGLYMSGHPLDQYRAETRAFTSAQIGVLDADDLSQNGTEDRFGRSRGPAHTFLAIITEVNRHTTKSGKPIAFAMIEDFTGQAEVVCFASQLDRFQQYLQVDEVVLIKGNTEIRGGTVKIIANEMMPMWKVREQMVTSVTLNLDSSALTEEKVHHLNDLCRDNKGGCRLYFDLDVPELPRGRQRIRSRNCLVEVTPQLMKGMQQLFGRDAVVLAGEES